MSLKYRICLQFRAVRLRCVVLACLGFAAQPALAANLWCSGTPENLYIADMGQLFIRGSWRTDYTQLCNVEGEWKGIPQQTCWSWYGILSSAITNTRLVTVYYSNSAYTCATMPTYEAAEPPGYVMLN